MVSTDNGQTQQVAPTDSAALDEAVRQAVTHILGVYQLLPDFVPAKADGVKAMPARTVSDEFLEACAVAAEHDPALQERTGLDPVRTRLVISRNLRFEALATAAEALVRDIRYNMFSERWDVVQQALQVYTLAKGFTRNDRADAFLGHVRKMKTAMGRNGNRGKLKTGPAPLPVPQKQ